MREVFYWLRDERGVLLAEGRAGAWLAEGVLRLVVHDEPVVGKVEAVGARLERAGHHLRDWRREEVRGQRSGVRGQGSGVSRPSLVNYS